MSEPLSFASSDDVLALLERRKAAPVAPPPVVATTLLIPRRSIPVQMVISGGQTGADRAGLDAALAVGLPTSGYCPKGRIAEDGAIPEQYTLEETGTSDYGERTALNVKHSSATIVLAFDPTCFDGNGGTAKTVRLCRKHGRPCQLVQLHPTLRASDHMVAQAVTWLRKRNVVVLNVAGPRESKAPGLQAAATEFLTRVLGQEPPTIEAEPQGPRLVELLP